MGTIAMFLAMPILSATGIYNPDVMKNGRCIAEPGTFNALYCPAPKAEAPKYKYRKKHAKR